MGRGPKKSPTKNKTSAPAQMDYAAESPSPCWPREPLVYAHINKLMIIAKEKYHTQDNQTTKGKLEPKPFH